MRALGEHLRPAQLRHELQLHLFQLAEERQALHEGDPVREHPAEQRIEVPGLQLGPLEAESLQEAERSLRGRRYGGLQELLHRHVLKETLVLQERPDNLPPLLVFRLALQAGKEIRQRDRRDVQWERRRREDVPQRPAARSS